MNTDYFRNLIMGNIFGTQTDVAIPTEYYLGLSKTAPNVNGANISEPSGSNYSRIPITGKLSTPSSGVISNTETLSFNKSSGSWGMATHYVVYDSESGGNLLFYGALSSPRTIDANSILVIPEGDLMISLSNPA